MSMEKWITEHTKGSSLYGMRNEQQHKRLHKWRLLLPRYLQNTARGIAITMWKFSKHICLKGFTFVLAATVLSCTFISCKNHTDIDKTISTFYIVRNAERYPGFNGHLTWYGRLRAGDLMRLLKDSGIKKIYVTPYSRTVETADSLIALQKTDTVVYRLDTTANELMHQLKKNKDFGRTLLIVGHRNMIPDIIRALGGQYPADTFPANVFNQVFEIRNDHGKARMKILKYGSANLADTASHEITDSVSINTK